MSADFVAYMEDVLDLYAEPYDPARPVVCFDESFTSAGGGLADTREPMPVKPGRPNARTMNTGEKGTRNLFLACEPKAGWRHVAITERRTREDFAHQMQWLVDEAYPDVPVVRLVLDNLNIQRTASLYEAFLPKEARRIAKRLEFHYTPKHGSWLNPVLSLPKGWRRSNSASSPAVVSGSATPMRNLFAGRCKPRNWSGTSLRPASTGSSLPRKPGANCVAPIRAYPDWY